MRDLFCMFEDRSIRASRRDGQDAASKAARIEKQFSR
jgi:hypothetical protein